MMNTDCEARSCAVSQAGVFSLKITCCSQVSSGTCVRGAGLRLTQFECSLPGLRTPLRHPAGPQPLTGLGDKVAAGVSSNQSWTGMSSEVLANLQVPSKAQDELSSPKELLTRPSTKKKLSCSFSCYLALCL